jgi:DNA-binding CsgD family transcriptional regulator
MAQYKNNPQIDSLDTLNHLITQIYDAAVDPPKWKLFLESLSDLCGGQTMGLLLYDRLNRKSWCDIPLSFVCHVNADADWIDEFERHYCTINPWMEHFSGLPEGTVACTSDLMHDDFFETAFYNDWLKRFGYRYSIGAQVIQGASLVVSLSGLRTDKASPQELKLYECLVPHLQRACNIHTRMAGSLAVAEAGGLVLDQLSIGIILLDQDGRLLHINQSAHDVLQQKNGLYINRQGYCVAAVASETLRLQQFIRDAVATGTGNGAGIGGSLTLTRTPPARPLSVLVSPFRGEHHAVLNGCVRAIVFVNDLDNPHSIPQIALLQQLFGLTIAQARLAQALGLGFSVEEYAEKQQLSLNTVRTHLKHLFNKTGTHRQGDLVRVLVTSLAFIRQD